MIAATDEKTGEKTGAVALRVCERGGAVRECGAGGAVRGIRSCAVCAMG